MSENFMFTGLIEKKKKPLFITGLDFSKTFDRVGRQHLMKLIRSVDVPTNISDMIEELYYFARTNLRIKYPGISNISQKVKKTRNSSRLIAFTKYNKIFSCRTDSF